MIDESIKKMLNEPLLAENVKQRDAFGTGKLSYIEGWFAISEANRIFGFDSWDSEILSLTEVDRQHYIKPKFNAGDKEKNMVSIAYLCKLRVSVKFGETVSVHEDVGFGSGVAGDTPNGLISSIELASKEAVTDAIKRCLRYFGSKFGLTLYEKEGAAPIEQSEYDASRKVTDEQLTSLTELLSKRGLDKEWALTWLNTEGWTEGIETLRNDWFQLVYNAVDGYGRNEREREAYISKFDTLTKLMKESVNDRMLKASFSDAWKLCTKFEDKDRQLAAQKLYEKIKVKFEEKK